jgi:hypothetical protein
LEKVNYSEDINMISDNIKESIQISAKQSLGLYEWKEHKPCFDEEWERFLDQRKQSKVQWLQDPNPSNIDDQTSVRREGSRHFRNKKKEFLKAKINELETNSKIKNISALCRCISDFKKGYQPRAKCSKG